MHPYTRFKNDSTMYSCWDMKSDIKLNQTKNVGENDPFVCGCWPTMSDAYVYRLYDSTSYRSWDISVNGKADTHMDAEDTPIFLPQLSGGELKMLTVIYMYQKAVKVKTDGQTVTHQTNKRPGITLYLATTFKWIWKFFNKFINSNSSYIPVCNIER